MLFSLSSLLGGFVADPLPRVRNIIASTLFFLACLSSSSFLSLISISILCFSASSFAFLSSSSLSSFCFSSSSFLFRSSSSLCCASCIACDNLASSAFFASSISLNDSSSSFFCSSSSLLSASSSASLAASCA
uniref:Uncharacterized protein n=1 Tax=Cacopsylla melanoneura TaxID=428564 RepID=A0A8D9A178_9HEMI